MGCNDMKVQENMMKYVINYNFFTGNQWMFEEDLAPFLKDETGQIRHRIRWCYNMFYPVVRYYMGMAIKTDYTARAFNVSPFRIERQEIELAKRLQTFDMAQAMPLLQKDFQNYYNHGGSIEETEQRLNEENENDYMDVAVNGVIRYIEDKNKFETEMKRWAALMLTLAGKATVKREIRGGEYVWRMVQPTEHFWDTAAKKADLSDAFFQGDVDLTDSVNIFEEFPKMDKETKKMLEEAIVRNTYNMVEQLPGHLLNISGRLPRYNVYWHDSEQMPFGYVRDALGMKFLACIKDKDDQATAEYEYSKKDLIPLNELTEVERAKVDDNATTILAKDVIRYSSFIPREFCAEDVVLSHGILKGTEYYNNPFEAAGPYRSATFNYLHGNLMTPLDPLWDPQRMMNRFVSVMENGLNKSGRKGTVIDQSLISAEAGGEDGLRRAMKNGDPVLVDGTKAYGGIQQHIGVYDNSNLGDSNTLLALVQSFRQMGQHEVGVNDFMMGTSDGTKVLKSVSQQATNMGTLMQEDFFYSLSSFFEQVYSDSANFGRRYYAENERKLVVQLKGKGVKLIQLTRDMMLDDMGIRLKRVPFEQTNQEANNALIMSLYSQQLIGDEEFADLFNQAEMDQIRYAVLSYAKKKAAVQKDLSAQNQAAQAKNDQMQQAMIQMDQMDKERERQSTERIAMQGDKSKLQREREKHSAKYAEKLLELRNR